MALAKFPKLARLPKRQRFKLAEELWFSGINDASPVSSWQREILDERWRAYQSGKAKRIPLHELERRLARS